MHFHARARESMIIITFDRNLFVVLGVTTADMITVTTTQTTDHSATAGQLKLHVLI